MAKCQAGSRHSTLNIYKMQTVRIKDKTFEIMMTEEELLSAVDAVAEKINRELDGKFPLFIAILNGSFMFMSDLMKRVEIPCELSFVKVSSYQGTSTTGKVQELIGLQKDITDRTVVIVEDIVETGFSMKKVVQMLRDKGALDIRICTMFHKPECLQIPLHLNYVGKIIPNDFILGYGLDYDQQGRNLPNLYKLKS